MSSNRKSLSPEAWRERLRAAGLRVTAPRLAALDFLQTHPHSDAAGVLEGITAHGTTATLQGVHTLLKELAEHQFLRRVDLPDSGSARYETRIHDNHHHLRCVDCGRIEDVDCAIGAAPCLTPSDDHGMKILAADVTFQAVCADCQQLAQDRADAAGTAAVVGQKF